MTSETLQKTLEQNRQNLKALLTELDADHEVPEDPEKKAEMGAIFHPGGVDAAKDVDLSEEERLAWLFQENAKALAAAVEEAGARSVKFSSTTESESMQQVKEMLSS